MTTGLSSFRPAITGASHMVSSGHWLATAAGYRILEEGGNAIDAGVAAGIVLGTVLPHWVSFGGVAPMIIHRADRNETVNIDGLGRWPKKANIDYFKQNSGGEIEAGVLQCLTPGAPDAYLTALKLYGTMTFEQVVTPALELAEGGFPVSISLQQVLEIGTAQTTAFQLRTGNGRQGTEGSIYSWPSTMEIFMPDGKTPEIGKVIVQKDLASTFRRLIDAERAGSSTGREAGLQAARDLFYKGEIAEQIASFIQSEGGFLSLDDMASYSVTVKPPVKGSFRDIDLYTCGPWSQGPVNIQALQILEGFDLKAMGHNSGDYLHAVIEALKLAFADREAFYGDPEFVNVPLAGLTSKEYSSARREALQMRQAFTEMPAAGDPWAYQEGTAAPVPKAPEPVSGPVQPDTSYACVVDRWGNAFSLTPSDGIYGAPVVPGLGLIASPRGSQSWLDPEHPSSLQPGKRPRLTPNPAMAFKDGKFWMTYGTPGGDTQCQSMTQVFLNVVEFGMDPQEAVEAARVVTFSMPSSFWPHAYFPGQSAAEGRIDPRVIDDLRGRGHKVEVWDDWSGRTGNVCLITMDREKGILLGGADARRESYAMGR